MGAFLAEIGTYLRIIMRMTYAIGAKVVSVLAWRIPDKKYERWGLYTQSSFVVIVYAFMELRPAYVGHSVATGYMIAALALAAVIMAARTDSLTTTEKIVWIAICAVLFMWELKVIDDDHVDQEKQHLADLQEQRKEFGATTEKLTSAVSAINQTMNTANRTLTQTAPHAAIRFTDFKFAEPDSDHLIKSGVSYEFNTSFENKGNDTAFISKILVKEYVGKPDDNDEQKRLEKKFIRDWRAYKDWKPSESLTDIPLINTTKYTLSQDDIMGFKDGTRTIYFLARIEYSDSSGMWDSQDCEAFQTENSTIDLNIRHSCSVFVNSRRPVKPQ